MPPASPSPATPVRTAAQVNAAIRALFRPRWGRGLTVEERQEYEQLLAEWAAAVRAEEARRGFVRAA